MPIEGVPRTPAAPVDGVFDAACELVLAARALERESVTAPSVTSLPAGVGAVEEALEALRAATDALDALAVRAGDERTHRALDTLFHALSTAGRRCEEARRTAALRSARTGQGSTSPRRIA